MVDVSSKIKALRIENGLSQEEFATRLGISRCSLSLWESGKRSPKKEQCYKIAKEFGLDLNYLLGYEARQDDPKCIQIPLYKKGKMVNDYVSLPSNFLPKGSYYAEMKNNNSILIIYNLNSGSIAAMIQKIENLN